MARYIVNEETREIYFFIPIKSMEVKNILSNLGKRYSDYYIGTMNIPPVAKQAPKVEDMIFMGQKGEA